MCMIALLLAYIQALSASGLRALRYAREVEGIGQVVALDNDKGASMVILSSDFILQFYNMESSHFCCWSSV